MKYPDRRFLFTIKDVTRACGVSRSTLIRMEECGFLTPFLIDNETGYRYYDADNIAQIGQYQLLQELGLNRTEITDFYLRRIDPENFINQQRKRLNRLQHALNEFEIRYTKNHNFKYSFIELSEVTCYCKKISLKYFTEMETIAYDIYQQIIQEGFTVNGIEPLFALFTDDVFTPLNEDETDKYITYCIPIKSSPSDNPNVKTFPACRAFSLICYGDYSDFSIITSVLEKYRKEFDRRNLKQAGVARGIASVAPYAGSHISKKDFCFEYAVPIEVDD